MDRDIKHAYRNLQSANRHFYVMKNLNHSLWSHKNFSINMYFSQKKIIYKTLFATSKGMVLEMHTWRPDQRIYFSAKQIPSLTALF